MREVDVIGRVEVHVEKIRQHHPDVRGHVIGQGCGQIAINFHGDDVPHQRCERSRERPPPGADFEKGVAGRGIERGNQLVDPRLLEEVLAEPFAWLMRQPSAINCLPM